MSQKSGFERYELDERVLESLPGLGFRRPTEVQHKVIPLFIQKKNLIVEAPTGTGKTAAYGLPLISRLNLLKRSTQALILVPTRELALQVAASLRSFYSGTKLKVGVVMGGVSMEESFEEIKASPHVLVVIPGRLRDVLAQHPRDYLWRDIKFLIIDEGDKLMEQGFQREFDLLREQLSSRIQICFFSATISSESEAMIRERVRPIMTVRLSPREMLRNIKFGFVKVKKGQRHSYLVGLLKQQEIGKALIFCGRREQIQTTVGFLRNCGMRAEAYYGNQEQNERANILRRFKEDHIDYLVASDLAARGLDIPELPNIINLNIPPEYEYYLHRIGRTGRAGRKGRVFNLIGGIQEPGRQKAYHREIGLPIREWEVRPEHVDTAKTSEDHKWVKYHFSRGKRDKVGKGDIVGFILNHSHLEAGQIGTITIYDSYSIVDMPQRGFSEISKLEVPLKIKGKSLKVRKYQLEEQEKKAQAIKRLKVDRKRRK
ncbi:MAG: DEAD/DEAH box helicase [Bacteroidota bacterium]